MEIVSNTRDGGPKRLDALEGVKLPFKSELEEETITVQCDVKFINFEGRVDGKAVRSILQYMQPKKVVAVHASPAAKTVLKTFCETDLNINVSIPNNLEPVQ